MGARIRTLLIAVGVLTLLAWGSFRLYQDPRVQELFRKSDRSAFPSGSGRAAGKSPAPTEITITPKRPAKSTSRPSAASSPESLQESKKVTEVPAPTEAPAEPPAVLNTVENQVVSRVVLQILAARNLASGIVLSTSDQVIIVEGTVDSIEKRNQILDVIEKAREARRIDAERLVVIGK